MQRRIAGLMDPYQRAFEEDDIKNGAPLTLPLSREAYEVLVRRCVKNSRPNIKFVTGTVTGVTAYTAHSGKGLHRVLFRTDVFGETEEIAKLVVVIVGIGAHNWSARPRSASEFLATYVDLADYRNGRISSWVFDIFKFFEEHEDQCEPFFLEYSHRSFSWVHYHKAEPGSLPNNFIAVGDALMRLNPSGGIEDSKPQATYEGMLIVFNDFI
ncbi:hypothetical protein FRB97_002418 [Tulasnella sp. 331]|nr:hypothetical protein FRB97_002418 [Tulasnella sp. 331]